MSQLQKQSIEQLNNKHTFYLRITHGAKELINNKWKATFLVMYLLTLEILSRFFTHWYLQSDFSSGYTWRIVQYLIPVIFLLLALLGIAQILILFGTPIGAKKIQDNLWRIGFTNNAGETPILLCKHKEKDCIIMEFATCGISLAEWLKRSDELGAILNYQIIDVRAGRFPRYIKLYVASPKNNLPTILAWNDNYLIQDSFSLVMGKNMLGTVTINLSKIPHILLGGSSGSGKSVLLKLLLMQCLKKNAKVYIADFKGGVDFPPIWHDKCFLIYYENEMLEILSQITDTLEQRKELFRESGCSDIDSYNAKTGTNLSRIIFACDELAEVLDKTGLSKDRKEQICAIESKLSIIARLGRAFGIHLILATQRPSADILSGQIKNNMDCRICGKADSILSQIILDNSDAATKIPKDSQGQFITNTGEVFQAFWLDDKKLE